MLLWICDHPKVCFCCTWPISRSDCTVQKSANNRKVHFGVCFILCTSKKPFKMNTSYSYTTLACISHHLLWVHLIPQWHDMQMILDRKGRDLPFLPDRARCCLDMCSHLQKWRRQVKNGGTSELTTHNKAWWNGYAVYQGLHACSLSTCTCMGDTAFGHIHEAVLSAWKISSTYTYKVQRDHDKRIINRQCIWKSAKFWICVDIKRSYLYGI